MRHDQFIGLPSKALAFLRDCQIVCPVCGTATALAKSKTGRYEGMYMKEYPLYRHHFSNGYADEFLQASPWNSGPVFFLGLLIYDNMGKFKEVIEWTTEAIEECDV